MPLRHGWSPATISYNIREMQRAGHPLNQAQAAAYSNAKRDFRKANPGKSLPDHLSKGKNPKKTRK